jgi:hypothetical protein
MSTIDQHIQKDVDILGDPMTSPQARRYTEEELKSLKSYKANHPDDDHDPNAFELYCDANPDALECRIYDS